MIIKEHVSGVSGIGLTQLVKNEYPDARIIVISNNNRRFYHSEAFIAGASALITKDDSVSELINVIRQICHGYTIISDEQKNNMMNQHLTDRERSVLLLVSRDKTNYEIGKELNISKRTVEYHISSILSKLNTFSRLGAVMEAIRKGIIDV